MFILRQARIEDQDQLLTLAQQLGTAGSLSQDPKELSELLEKAEKSFALEIPKEDCKYVFVLEDVLRSRVLGCSMITAKQGRPQKPQTYLRVLQKSYSDASTGIKSEHQLLRFEYDEDGPSVIGGLILDQDFRNSPVGLGRLLSWGRFLYMGLHADRFESEVLAELLPPFNEDGTSELWEAFGRRFIDMSYQEADRLSRNNNDFIRNLFPQEDIYTALLSEKAQAVIGQCGPSTRAAQKLLEKIGFAYMNAVDPFDGGPYFMARLKEITLIKRLQKARLSQEPMIALGNRALVAGTGSRGFFCLCIHVKKELKDLFQVGPDPYKIFESEGAVENEIAIVSPI